MLASVGPGTDSASVFYARNRTLTDNVSVRWAKNRSAGGPETDGVCWTRDSARSVHDESRVQHAVINDAASMYAYHGRARREPRLISLI